MWEHPLGASPVHLLLAALSLEPVPVLTGSLSDVLQPCSPVSHRCQSWDETRTDCLAPQSLLVSSAARAALGRLTNAPASLGGTHCQSLQLGYSWSQEENQPLSKCPVEEFDLFPLLLKIFICASVATPVLVAATHNWCPLSQPGREWAVTRCLRALFQLL